LNHTTLLQEYKRSDNQEKASITESFLNDMDASVQSKQNKVEQLKNENMWLRMENAKKKSGLLEKQLELSQLTRSAQESENRLFRLKNGFESFFNDQLPLRKDQLITLKAAYEQAKAQYTQEQLMDKTNQFSKAYEQLKSDNSAYQPRNVTIDSQDDIGQPLVTAFSQVKLKRAKTSDDRMSPIRDRRQSLKQ
jgi:hypothetical protein